MATAPGNPLPVARLAETVRLRNPLRWTILGLRALLPALVALYAVWAQSVRSPGLFSMELYVGLGLFIWIFGFLVFSLRTSGSLGVRIAGNRVTFLDPVHRASFEPGSDTRLRVTSPQLLVGPLPADLAEKIGSVHPTPRWRLSLARGFLMAGEIEGGGRFRRIAPMDAAAFVLMAQALRTPLRGPFDDDGASEVPDSDEE